MPAGCPCTQWSTFGQQCIGNVQTSTRRCLPTCQGTQQTTRTQACTGGGGGFGQWLNWNNWGSCSSSCTPGGSQTRFRQCSTQFTQNCVGQSYETQPCNQFIPCNTGFGQWLNWNNWGSCSSSCTPGGSQTRFRQCSTQFTQNCVGQSFETQPCNQFIPCNTGFGQWLNWNNWGSCSSSCTPGGSQTRFRQCSTQFTQNCVGQSFETQPCNQFIPCNTGFGQWLNWNNWGSCSSSCTPGGSQTRYRQCSTQFTQNCVGQSYETQPCNQYIPCNTGFGQWLNWNNWGSCSSSCTPGGSQTRFRQCSTQFTQNCVGQSYETQPCNQFIPCNTGFGQWLNWNNWGSCSSSCAPGGSQTRFRQCSTGNTQNCVGQSFDTQSCNQFTNCLATGKNIN